LHHHLCYYCHQPITNDEWDDEHIIPKEMMPPGSDWNDWSNRAPIHRVPCHKEKTAKDIAAIAKSNRIRRAAGPVELRKKKTPIKGRSTFPKGRGIPSRPFPKRTK
jgi:5-methylcytosine-specific restriction endonuclease McrA